VAPHAGKYIVGGLLAGFVAAVVTTAACAADFVADGNGWTMRMDGDITMGDAARFRLGYENACAANGHCPNGILLNSRGGGVAYATELAGEVEAHGMVTGVARDNECCSACVLVFAAGVAKSVTKSSFIGVHRAFDVVRDNKGVERFIDTEGSLRATLDMAAAYRRGNVPQIVIDKMLSTPGEQMTQIHWNEWPGLYLTDRDSDSKMIRNPQGSKQKRKKRK
jgi:hypothetical protein